MDNENGHGYGLTRPLAGLNVLVTRPRERAAELCGALERAGAAVRHLPLLAIEPLIPGVDQQRLQQIRTVALELDRYQRIVCVSVTAVEHGLNGLAGFRPGWPGWPGKKPAWYGVGAATAKALSAAGLRASQPGGAMNSEALLAMPDWQSLSGERILIIRGVGGRDYLAGELIRRGAEVEILECYRRALPAGTDAEALRAAALWADAIGINSGETLAHLDQLWRAAGGAPGALGAALVVPGPRIAGLARSAGFRHVVAADNAGTEATVAALRQRFERQQQSAQGEPGP